MTIADLIRSGVVSPDTEVVGSPSFTFYGALVLGGCKLWLPPWDEGDEPTEQSVYLRCWPSDTEVEQCAASREEALSPRDIYSTSI